jgi:hypothetical protein
VARLGGPADLAVALPHLLGFTPTESLVVVALHGPRHRVGLTIRADLPARAHQEPLVADVVDRVVHTGAQGALVVLCTEACDDGGGLPRAAMVRRLLGRLRGAGLDADDAVLVRDGRWASYVCRKRCCPVTGTPLPQPDSSDALSLVAVDAVARGVAVLANRDELVVRLTPPPPETAALRALDDAEAGRLARTGSAGRVQEGRAGLVAWRRALTRAPDADLPAGDAARLVTALHDVVVRDEVLTWLLDDDEALLGLLLNLAGQTPSPHDAAVCALLGWVAHARGDGALANIALDRALASEPGCTLAQLSRQALDGQLPPSDVREMLTESRQVLRAAHPWTAAR